MGRLVASVLIVLLAPLATAIEDPAGDVGATVGGAPIDVPYIDIRNVTATLNGELMVLRMTMDGPFSEAPVGLDLSFIFPFILGGSDGDTVYGQEDGTILCSFTSGAGDLSCHDSTGRFAVTGAGISWANLTATVRLGQAVASIAVAGLSNQIENGNVTAQDVTDNALPYSSRPDTSTSAPTVGAGDAPHSFYENRWFWIAILVVAIAAFVWRRQRA